MKKALLISLLLANSVAFTSSYAQNKDDNTVFSKTVSHPKDTNNKVINIDNLLPAHGLTDPHVWIENGRIYLFAGHDTSWRNDKDWIIDSWQIWSSDNLYDWKYESEITPEQTYMGKGGNCWAGDIIKRGDKYYWYFSNRNTDIGVMVSDRVDGGFKDALGKPLIEAGVTPVHSYDPEVIEIDGEYYIIFGAGSYYIAKLAEDMISLAEEPKLLHEKNGDKPAMFVYNDLIYLFWDNTYVTSENIYGPYSKKKKYVKGGHGCSFEWDNQWYTLLENDDISQFYRGISLKPLNFDSEGNVVIPDGDSKYPGIRRDWEFKNAAIGWIPEDGTTVKWNKKKQSIEGEIAAKGATISSVNWLMNEMKGVTTLKISLKNQTSAKSAKVKITTFDKLQNWRDRTDNLSEHTYILDISQNDKDYKNYEIQLDNSEFRQLLKSITIQPATEAQNGKWEIENISLF
ncbi:MAG: family 43 glycosylhydrolase [Rikenellaceae bacterium]